MSHRSSANEFRFLLICFTLFVFILGIDTARIWAIGHAAPVEVIAPGCQNLINNGDFEVISPDWQFIPSANAPVPVQAPAFPPNGSQQAIRLGIIPGLPNVPGLSEVRYKPLQLPASAASITLRFQYAPFAEPGNTDRQRVEIFYANTSQYVVLDVHENDGIWKFVQIPLTAFAGQGISLRFLVTNDGLGGRTWMYIDNVEIEYCPPGTPLPPTPTWTPIGPPTATFTPLPSPTATPIPSTPTPLPPPPEGCNTNIVQNGTFETDGGWILGADPNPPVYVINQHHEGARAILLGHGPETSSDWASYSSIRQLVTIPSNVQRAELRWWHLYGTQQAADPNPSGASDRQEVLLLTNTGRRVLKVVQRVLRNETDWTQDAVDVTALRGQTFYLYFNVFNDGNNLRTWAYLDEVMLNLCYGPVTSTPIPPPTATLVPPTATLAPPTPTVTPTETPVPTATLVTPTDTPLAQELARPQAQIQPSSTATPGASLVTPSLALPVTIEAVTVEANLNYLAATETADAISITVRLVPPKIVSTYVSPGWGLALGTLAVLLGIIVASFLLAALWVRLSNPERFVLALLLAILVIALSVRFLRNG